MASCSFGVVFVVCLAVYSVAGTDVRQCKYQYRSSGEMMTVDISDCSSPPCKLVRNTTASVEIAFKPDVDVDALRNSVWAQIVIPLPFLGVDGQDACDKVFQADGVTPAGCPLTAGTQYVYKNSFYVYNTYPAVSLVVHWGLRDKATNKNIICFEVESRILPASS